MSIPFRHRGYSIDETTLVTHERYQDHAPYARRVSVKGALNIAGGRSLVPCGVCFPQPKPEPPKRTRARVTPEPETVTAAEPTDLAFEQAEAQRDEQTDTAEEQAE